MGKKRLYMQKRLPSRPARPVRPVEDQALRMLAMTSGVCPDCGASTVNEPDPSTGGYEARCPQCGWRGQWGRFGRPLW